MTLVAHDALLAFDPELPPPDPPFFFRSGSGTDSTGFTESGLLNVVEGWMSSMWGATAAGSEYARVRAYDLPELRCWKVW